MLLEHERDSGLGMDALVTVCSRNTNGIMVWAWMLWSADALGTRTRLWFGHGCSGHRMLWEHERDYGLGMDALVMYALGTRTGLWFGHGCSGQRMLWEHERDYGLGMDALVSVQYALGTRTALWASARGARALGAGGAKLLVSPLITPIVLPYIIPYITPFKEFRL